MIPKKYLKRKLEEMIEEKYMQLARNEIVREYNKTLDTVEAKKEVDAATFNIGEIEKTTKWLLEYQKTLE